MTLDVGGYEGLALRIEYFDHNERFAAILPRSGVVVRRLHSTNGVDNWFLLKLSDPFEYEGHEYQHLVIRSRWAGHEIGEREPTSVFVLLAPDFRLIDQGEFEVDKLDHVCWGMAHSLSVAT